MPEKQDLTVGEAVYYAREQKLGIIYATYERGRLERPGVQVLLGNGTDLSGFSAEEADQFLQPLGDTGLDYDFQNVGRLHQDYQRGVFGEAFHAAQVLHISHSLATAQQPQQPPQ